MLPRPFVYFFVIGGIIILIFLATHKGLIGQPKEKIGGAALGWVKKGENVGIGTDNPQVMLDVAGTIRARDVFFEGGKNLIIGDDVYLTDIDKPNFLGIYGIQENEKAGVKLGGRGGYIFGDNGNIGINTKNPQTELDVNGFVRGRKGLCIGNDCRTTWPTSGGKISVISRWFKYKNNLYYIGGNVGIGTSHPNNTLDVIGTLDVSGTSYLNGIVLDNDSDIIGADRIVGYDDLRLYGDSFGGPDLYITKDGKVGIGTISPSQKLEVQGYIKTEGICLGGECRSTWSSQSSFSGGVSGSGYYGYIPLWRNSNSLGNSVIYQAGSFVGIGTSNPSSRLDVQGYVKADGFCLKGECKTTWSSFEESPWKKEGDNVFYLGGNVGIGTSYPEKKLDVEGFVRGRRGICIGNDCKTEWPQCFSQCKVCVQCRVQNGDGSWKYGEIQCTSNGWSNWSQAVGTQREGEHLGTACRVYISCQ